jgi:hypothetical protein
MPTALRKLLALGPAGWRDLVRAQLALFAAQRTLREQPTGALAIRESVRAEDAVGDAARAQALGLAVSRVARFGLFRPYCLVQALAIRRLLREEGIHGASIRVGVRRANGEFQAHAWVRWGHEILGDTAGNVSRFTEVEDLRVMGLR